MNTAISPGLITALIFATIWQLFWKGIAFWRAAKLHQKKWFIALVVLSPLNDLGVVPIVYLFFFAKHPLTLHEMIHWLPKKKA
jgi:hypothetical protein